MCSSVLTLFAGIFYVSSVPEKDDISFLIVLITVNVAFLMKVLRVLYKSFLQDSQDQRNQRSKASQIMPSNNNSQIEFLKNEIDIEIKDGTHGRPVAEELNGRGTSLL